MDWQDFSIRLLESELPDLVRRLKAVPAKEVRAMRRVVMWLRDYFVYKDMYNPSTASREKLLGLGRPQQDAFLILALALEARARSLGHLVEKESDWRTRNEALLGGTGNEALAGSKLALMRKPTPRRSEPSRMERAAKKAARRARRRRQD